MLGPYSSDLTKAIAPVTEKYKLPMIAVTHCKAADVIGNFGDTVNNFFCPTHWAETLSYSDDYFGSAAEYDQLFKATYDGYSAVPYQAA